jgi:hypothetical protein
MHQQKLVRRSQASTSAGSGAGGAASAPRACEWDIVGSVGEGNSLSELDSDPSTGSRPRRSVSRTTCRSSSPRARGGRGRVRDGASGRRLQCSPSERFTEHRSTSPSDGMRAKAAMSNPKCGEKFPTSGPARSLRPNREIDCHVRETVRNPAAVASGGNPPANLPARPGTSLADARALGRAGAVRCGWTDPTSSR